jgi:mRNA interferase MazF
MGRAVIRGDIWWADLAQPRGSEPGKRRPVVVVQHNALTASRLQTVIVVPITSNIKRATAPGNVLLSKSQSKLNIEGVALCCQVLAIDKVFMTNLVSHLPASAMSRIDDALKLTLALT